MRDWQDSDGNLIATVIACGFFAFGYYRWQHKHDNGWEITGSAPWCQAVTPTKKMACEFFSEEHCEHVGRQQVGSPYGPTEDPLCVKNPRD